METAQMILTSVSSIALPTTAAPPPLPPPKPTSGDSDSAQDTDSSAPVKADTPPDVGRLVDITA